MGTLVSTIATLAPNQAGTVARYQLAAAGIDDTAVRRAVDRGWLRQVDIGVYVVSGSPASHLQDMWIAHLRCGATSVLSLWTAGRHWRFDAMRPGRIVLTIPHRRGTPPPELEVRRTRRLESADVTVVDGLPFTSPARTVVDLAGACGQARLARIVDSAHFGGKAPYVEVGQCLLRLGSRGRRGSGVLARLLDDRVGDPLPGSALERLLADLVSAAGLVMGHDAVRQHPLPSGGDVTGTVDLFLPAPLVIVEADGRRWHQRQADMKRDRERDFAAAQVGAVTVRLLHEHLTSDLDGCAAGLRRVVESRELGRSANTP